MLLKTALYVGICFAFLTGCMNTHSLLMENHDTPKYDTTMKIPNFQTSEYTIDKKKMKAALCNSIFLQNVCGVKVTTDVPPEDVELIDIGEQEDQVFCYVEDKLFYITTLTGHHVYAPIDSSELFSFKTEDYNSYQSLTTIDLSELDTSNAINMDNMFKDDTNLVRLVLDDFNTDKVSSMNNIFQNCSSLEVLNLSSFDLSNCKEVIDGVKDCDKLKQIECSANTANLLLNTEEWAQDTQSDVLTRIEEELDK